MIKLGNLSQSLRFWLQSTLQLGPGIGDVFYLCDPTVVGDNYHVWLANQRVPGDHIFNDLPTAYTAMKDQRNDALIVLPGTYNITTVFDWHKSNCFVIGANQGTPYSPRARIIVPATVITACTPMITVSGNANFFQNIEFQQGGAHITNAAVCMLITGLRQRFNHCHIAAGLDSGGLAAGNAAMRSLVIRTGENIFEDCVIGVDTIQGGNVANAQIDFDGGAQTAATLAPRNIFRRCNIDKWGGVGSVFMNISAYGMDRFVLFEDCMFQNFGANLTQAFTIVTTGGVGKVLLKNSVVQGVTGLETSDSGLLFGNDVPGAGTGGRWVALTG
jgi:hypothetical protein